MYNLYYMVDKSSDDDFLFEEINMGQKQTPAEILEDYLEKIVVNDKQEKREKARLKRIEDERQKTEDVETKEHTAVNSTKKRKRHLSKTRTKSKHSTKRKSPENINYLKDHGVFDMLNIWGYNTEPGVTHVNYEDKTHLDRYGLWGRLLQSYTDPIMRPLAKLQSLETREIFDYDVNIFKRREYIGPDSDYASYPEMHKLLIDEVLLPFMRTTGVEKGLKAYQKYCEKRKGAKYRTLEKAVDALFYLADGNYEKAAKAEQKKS